MEEVVENAVNEDVQQPQEITKKPGLFSQIKMKHLFRGDGFIWFFVLILMTLSLIFIFSSTASLIYKHHPDNPGFYVIRRFAHLLAGAFAIFCIYPLNSKKYYKWANWIFLACIGGLILTFLIGTRVNNATRSIGPIQPSDFAKIGMIIMLAKILTQYKDIVHEVSFLPIVTWISMLKKRFGYGQLTKKAQRKQDKKNERVMYIWKNYSWRFLLPIAIIAVLILPSNLSTALIVSMMGIAVLIIGGIRFVEVFKLGAILGGVGYIILFSIVKTGIFARGETWLSRLNNFFTGSDSFQSHHAKIAIAQGWIPQGPGNSVQRASLPRAESDFMFAFIVEEYSFIAVIPIILLYIWIFQRAIVIAKKHNDRFEAILCTGIAFFICFQALMHMFVNIGFAPVTGLVLPFLSNGGSAIVSMCVAIAIILNISMHQRKFEKQELRAKEEALAAEEESVEEQEIDQDVEVEEEEIDQEEDEEEEEIEEETEDEESELKEQNK